MRRLPAFQSVGLNGKLLRRLVDGQFEDGLKGFQGAWDSEGGPSRATFYRWIDGRLPKTQDQLLRMAQLLDVDPFCLLTIEGADGPSAAEQLIRAIQGGPWVTALTFIKDFMGRRSAWPPDSLAETHFDRSWTVQEFEHQATGRKNHYAIIQLSSTRQEYALKPQVFHFAFRHPTFFNRRWLQYGLVVRIGCCARLIHINGFTDSAEVPMGPTRVATFFGEGPAIFKVASLHPFSLAVTDEPASERDVLRFPA